MTTKNKKDFIYYFVCPECLEFSDSVNESTSDVTEISINGKGELVDEKMDENDPNGSNMEYCGCETFEYPQDLVIKLETIRGSTTVKIVEFPKFISKLPTVARIVMKTNLETKVASGDF